MNLVQIIYASRTCRSLDQGEIIDILRKSQAKNQKNKISGLLLYCNGQFLQLIEGPEKAVNELFDTISNDSRHNGIEIIHKTNVESMVMPTWAMGYFSPELNLADFQDAFLLKEASTRSICEFLPENIGKYFLEFIGKGMVKK